MKTPVFTGACVAIVTPFNEDYSVNYKKLADLIEFQIEGGTDAITICGTTGEASALDDAEHKECIRFAVECVHGRIPVIAGTGSNDTAYAVQLSKYAESVGADALLQVTPYYNKTTQAGLVKHFTAVTDSTSLPVILYNVPSRTGMSIAADTYRILSQNPKINGVKEASGNFSLIAQTRALCGDELNIWSGNDDQAVPVMSLGGRGVISVASNIAPRIVADMCRAALSGDFDRAGRMQTEYFDFFNDLFCEVNPIPIKAAMNIAGMDVGPLRMPLCDISPAHAELLKKTLSRFNII